MILVIESLRARARLGQCRGRCHDAAPLRLAAQPEARPGSRCSLSKWPLALSLASLVMTRTLLSLWPLPFHTHFNPKVVPKFSPLKFPPFWRPTSGDRKCIRNGKYSPISPFRIPFLSPFPIPFYPRSRYPFYPRSDTLFIPVSYTLFIPVSHTLFIPALNTLFILVSDTLLSLFLTPPSGFPVPFLVIFYPLPRCRHPLMYCALFPTSEYHTTIVY